MNYFYIILGPTASGKSTYAFDLAKKINGYLINADSTQVYKFLSVGTEKDVFYKCKMQNAKCKSTSQNTKIKKYKENILTPITQHEIEYYLWDIVTPDYEYSVNEYQKDVYEILEYKQKTDPKKTPIMVGGTGLYIDAVVDGFVLPKIKVNRKLRKRLYEKSCEELFSELKKKDPKMAEKIDKKNPRRLVRALEVIHETCKKYSDLRKKNPIENKGWAVKKIGLMPRCFATARSVRFLKPDRSSRKPNKKFERYEKKLKDRVIDQIKRGLIEETIRAHHELGYSWDCNVLQSFVYQEVHAAFEQAVQQSKKDNINSLAKYIRINPLIKNSLINNLSLRNLQYAKRQMTWFKRDKKIKWIEV